MRMAKAFWAAMLGLLSVDALAADAGHSREGIYRSLLSFIAPEASADPSSPIQGNVGAYGGSIAGIWEGLSAGLVREAGLDPAVFGESTHLEMMSCILVAVPPEELRQILDRASKKLFGKPLSRGPLAPGGLHAYDSAGLRAAFDALYPAPHERLGGVRAQAVYDAVFKAFMKRQAEEMAALLDRPEILDAKAREYAERASGPDFDGAQYQGALVSELKMPDVSDGRLLGMMLRRRLDGTLSVVVTLLRTVIKDYDPELFQRLDSRLRA
jgi:predicted lipid-binding transport protein (Tim44 family)